MKSAFPTSWKLGHVIPVFKKDPSDPTKDKTDPKNYRPITLLSGVSKICEKVISDRIFDHLLRHNLHLYPLQSGFTKGHGTTDQLIAITDYLNHCCDVVLLFSLEILSP